MVIRKLYTSLEKMEQKLERTYTTLFATSVLLTCICSTRTEADETGLAVMTFAILHKQGITQFLNKTIMLKAKIKWDYVDVKIPEDPRSIQSLSKITGKVKVPFDDVEIPRFRGKKYLWATSSVLAKISDDSGKQQYAFKDRTLSNGQEYLLQVHLKLRSMFKEEHLRNPEFIKQSNKPRYWNQTFELEILSVGKAAE